MRRPVTAAVGAVAIALPTANAVAAANSKAAPKQKTVSVTKKVSGPQAQASDWGFVQVTLIVKKTTTTVGKKSTVARKITGVSVPVYPSHTSRSVFISQQAIPLLEREVLTAQFNPSINMISGATVTSDAFIQSLQAAVVQAQQS